jgi:hypothetical protein
LDLSGLHIAAGRTSGVRVIREADAVIECKLVTTFEAGDHDVLVGEVASAYATPDFDMIWQVDRYSYANYVGSIGDGDSARRVFTSPAGEVDETRWPRSEAVFRRSRDHRSVEEAGLGVKGKEIHTAAKLVSGKTGLRVKDALFLLEEMRRQGLVQLGGRLAASDFE